MNTEYNKISILEITPFDKLRANGINQSFLNTKQDSALHVKPHSIFCWASFYSAQPTVSLPAASVPERPDPVPAQTR